MAPKARAGGAATGGGGGDATAKAGADGADNLTLEQQEALAEQERLTKKAYDSGVIAKAPPLNNVEPLPIADAVAHCHGADIVKKGLARRNRYLLLLNCRLAPAAAGRLGTLAQLDSRNPVLYLDFPCGGRLKLLGTLAFPSNKYMSLRLPAVSASASAASSGPGGHQPKPVQCDDVFESVVVFSEAVWVGRAEDNPAEAPLPLPAHLVAEAGGAAEGDPGPPPDYAFGAAAAAPRRARGGIGGTQAASEDGAGASGEGGSRDGTPGPPSDEGAGGGGRRPRRAAAVKRPRYVDGDDDADLDGDLFDDDDEGGGSGEGGGGGRRKRGRSTAGGEAFVRLSQRAPSGSLRLPLSRATSGAGAVGGPLGDPDAAGGGAGGGAAAKARRQAGGAAALPPLPPSSQRGRKGEDDGAPVVLVGGDSSDDDDDAPLMARARARSGSGGSGGGGGAGCAEGGGAGAGAGAGGGKKKQEEPQDDDDDDDDGPVIVETTTDD